MVFSEFKTAVREKVHSTICMFVICWSCCVCATEVDTTSTVNLMYSDKLGLSHKPKPKV